jgi:branched-chain amino acid transport system permease protein
MLIVGGSGNNLGALLGAALVSVIWSATGLATGVLFPPAEQAQAAALRIIAIGVLLAVTLVLRPRGLLGERAIVSRHVAGSAVAPGEPP